MRTTHLRLLFGLGALVLFTGCATGDEWQTWKEHPTHFASGDHMFFSTRNRDGSSPKVTRQDIAQPRGSARKRFSSADPRVMVSTPGVIPASTPVLHCRRSHEHY